MTLAARNRGPFTLTSGEALAINRFVKISASTAVYCDAGDEPIGRVTQAVATATPAAIDPLDGTVHPVVASKAISAGAAIYAANDGKVSDAANGKQLGIALQAATADGGVISAIIWGPRGGSDLNSSKASWIYYMEDFLTGSLEDGHKFSASADKADWLFTSVDGDSDAAEVINVDDDAPGGWLEITTNDKASDSEEGQLNGTSFKLAVGKELWFEAAFAIKDVSECDFFIGLAAADTTVMAGVADRVGFELNNDGNLDALVEQNTTQSSTDTTVDVEDCAAVANLAAKKVTVKFHWDGVDTVRFYVDGVLKTTKTDNGSTILIPDDVVLTPTICVKAASGAAQTAWTDYIEIHGER